ncbi:MAG: hypothetical protein C5B44_00935 [Acidobacteria bacterium]|nr:MAG: hypothetical protein C5B44_00935 [Acidobacteriota bacterium]
MSEKIAQLEDRLHKIESFRASSTQPLSLWLTNILQGVTLVTIGACAFSLGSLSSTVSATSTKLDKLNDAVIGVSRESLSNRVSIIETKLDSLSGRVDAIEARLDSIDKKLEKQHSK